MTQKRPLNPLSKNIKTLRNSLGISQHNLGVQLNRDRRFIERIEKGGKLDAEYLFPLAEALGIKDPRQLIESEIVIENRIRYQQLGLTRQVNYHQRRN